MLREKPVTLVLHVDINNSLNETSLQIYNKLTNLVYFAKENNANCHVMLSSPIYRLNVEKVALTIKVGLSTREYFFKKSHLENEAGRLVPDLFLFSEKALYEINTSSLQLSFNIL